MSVFNIPWQEIRTDKSQTVYLHHGLIWALDQLRKEFGNRLVCHCLFDGDRVPTNLHAQGKAADLHIEGLHPLDQFMQVEKQRLFGGIGVYGPDVWLNPGLHVDIRDRMIGARWAFKAVERRFSPVDAERVQVALDKEYIKYLLEIKP